MPFSPATTPTDSQVGDTPSAPTFVISPHPVLWMQEFAAANDRTGRLPVWRELAVRAQQRGSKALAGRDWSGPVLLPSGVIGHLLSRRSLNAPERWQSLPSPDLNRFIAVLNAWQSAKLIFDFSGLAGQIVTNSEVSFPLNAKAFSLIPAPAIYVDFESLNFRERNLPGGFFAGLNLDDRNRLELVVIIDRFDRVQVHSFPLDGKTVEQAMSAILRSARKKGLKDGAWQETVNFVDHHLHTVLSAILLVSSSQNILEHIEDGVSRADGHGMWTRWRIRKAFTDPLNNAYEKAERMNPAHSPIVVAQWVDPHAESVANLRCSICDRREWSEVQGMPGEFRIGSTPGHH